MTEQISEHVWWMGPGEPDRPSLCLVVGARRAIMLDGGSSAAHARSFLDGVPRRPDAVVYTHSHWDHVFGGAETGGLVIAERRTAERLVELAARDWSDDALSGQSGEHIKQELPSPRTVEIAQADVIFDSAIDLDLGGVTIRVRHVRSDHCDDACIAFVEQDRLLFLGDCLCASGGGVMTEDVAFPLFDTVLGFDAELHVEGHHPVVTSRVEMERLLDKARTAARGNAVAGDEDSEYFAAAFAAGVGPTLTA